MIFKIGKKNYLRVELFRILGQNFFFLLKSIKIISNKNFIKSSSGSNKSNPSCKLSVTYKGKLGNSYLDYVKVGFQSKTSDNGAEITEFGLGTSAQLNGSSTLRIEQPGQYTVYGMVKDSNGVTAECRATFSIVKEQKSEPVCSLYVDATQLSDGTYSKGATVKFRTKTSTNGAEIVDFGIGTDYKLSGNDTFSVGVGTYKVYGMVNGI